MGNRIPRNATRLEAVFLTDTTAGKSGTKLIAEKTENGWVGTCEGKSYRLFLGHLRDEKLCKVKVIA